MGINQSSRISPLTTIKIKEYSGVKKEANDYDEEDVFASLTRTPKNALFFTSIYYLCVKIIFGQIA